MSKPHCNCATSYPNNKGFCERCGGYYGPITQLATATKNIEHYQACESVYRKERDALKQERDECKAAFEIAKQQMVLALEGKVALAAQLAEVLEANKQRQAENDRYYHAQRAKAERLERALARVLRAVDKNTSHDFFEYCKGKAELEAGE